MPRLRLAGQRPAQRGQISGFRRGLERVIGKQVDLAAGQRLRRRRSMSARAELERCVADDRGGLAVEGVYAEQSNSPVGSAAAATRSKTEAARR